uniref:Uncharacterized protein n=1 Tax=viral metagenome TaxID=1070528 RepID=A0A6M3X4R5_9ZZZZ
MPENIKYGSSSVEAEHKALNHEEPQTEPETPSKLWFRGHFHTKEELELIIDLWSILNRIDKITKIEARAKALENWRALRRYLLER